MAEDNSDQNIAQPQNDAQQAAPQAPEQPVADETQASITEPIEVRDSDERPTTAIPAVDASDDTTDYASAAGESTVVGTSPQSAPTEQYRPAPEYGAYGPVPTQQPANGAASQAAAGQTAGNPVQPQQGQPQQDRPFFGNFGNPYANGDRQNQPNGNPFAAPAAQNGSQPRNGAQPQYGANVPPAGNGNPFGAPGQGAPNQPVSPVVTKQKSGTASHVVTAVVAALVSGALCLGVGFTAISNGWVHVPSSSSLSDVKSNTSGSGSAKVKSGQAVDWSAVAKEVSDSVVAIDVTTSDGEAKGSGVVISDKGYIATNNHVISGGQQIQVTLASGAMYSAQVVGTDTTTDLAVIKLDNPPSYLKVAEFADSDDLAVGESVMAIGNPLGYDDTVTTGIVSALNRPVTVTDDDNNAIVTNAVQIDAAINPGNSGGPASKAGVKAGDSIVAFNGKAVNNNYSLLGYVRASAMGDKVKLTVVRGGNTMDLEVTLDQEETKTNSSNRREQRQQNNNGNNGDNDNNSNGDNGFGNNGNNNNGDGDGGGLFDPFGLW